MKTITQFVMAILCLALPLLMWAGAASAETHSVIVSQHVETKKLSKTAVKLILKNASKVLQSEPRPENTTDVACDVGFTLKEPIRTFKSPQAPATVRLKEKGGEEDKNKIHRVGRKDLGGGPLSDGRYLGEADFYVKVVKRINFCRGGLALPDGCERGQCNFVIYGCAYPPESLAIIESRTIIISQIVFHHIEDEPRFPSDRRHLLWAHEFGHLAGLPHRKDKDEVVRLKLMTGCSVTKLTVLHDEDVVVDEDECRCLRSGPGVCPLPKDPIGCEAPRPKKQSRVHN